MKKTVLNAEQKRAVNIKSGPALVVAGAGTGKTRVIVERIAKLIDGGVDRNAIVALTFTEKAAQEMLDRVSELLPGSYGTDMAITTFNSFGESLLRQYAPEIGLSGTLKLLGDVGKSVFLREHLDELGLDYFAPISQPDGQIDNLADYFSRLKQQLVKPAGYKKYADTLPDANKDERLDKKRQQELAEAFKRYVDLARSNNFMDYDDQLYLVVELLEKRPNVLAKIQKQYQHILVDEFQDTNPMQSKVIDLLAGEHRNLMVVGDDDQSIYGWRGATLANILDFKKKYPKADEVTLTRNYRTTQAILDSAYKLIQNNNPERLEHMHGLDKKLVSSGGQGQPPQLKSFSSLQSELEWIAQDIKAKIKAGENPGGIAVLARRNTTAQKIHEYLELNGIEHVSVTTDNDLYRHPAVSTMVEALKTVADKHDNSALYHTLGGALFKIDAEQLAEPAATARKRHLSLWEALEESDDAKIQSSLELIAKWRASVHDKYVGSLAYDIITDSGFKDEVYSASEEDEEGFLRAQALSAWFQTLKDFERAADMPSTLSYLDNLDVLKAAGDELGDDTVLIDNQTVNVLSVHKAKGLEWKMVYIADLTEYSFPMQKRSSSLSVPEELMSISQADEHYAEERRLMYVAMTRAKEELILTYSRTHTGTTKRKPSRFLKEVFGDELLQAGPDSKEQVSLELFAASETPSSSAKLPARMRSGNNLVLTASQIGDYMRCPQDFYYRHILGVPPPPNPATQVGTLLHEIIQDINQAKQAGKELPKREDCLQKLEDNWPQEGYHSAQQRDRALKQTLKHFKDFYSRIKEAPAPSQTEQSFRAAIPDADLLVIGRLDAVYETEDGIEIRDFKSGTTVTDEEKAKSRATGSNQLAVYALAWKLANGQLPEKLTLDYVQTGQTGSVKKQEKTLDRLEDKLKQISSDIRSGKFPPGRDHRYCRHPL